MIAVAVATRGLIHTRTMQSIFDGISEMQKLGIPCKLLTTHDLPIPDSQNYLVEASLNDKNVKKVFFIEEDMHVFSETFVALCTSDADITTVQYNDKNGSPHGIIHYNELGEILWAGLGATIVKREVFGKIGKPYFRIDIRYRNVKKHVSEEGKAVTVYEEIEPRQVWDDKENKFVPKHDDYKYGGQDINFYTRAKKAGCSIVSLDNHKAQHFHLVKLGEMHVNNGCHIIRQV